MTGDALPHTTPRSEPHPFDRVRTRGLLAWTLAGGLMAAAAAAVLLPGADGAGAGEAGLRPAEPAFLAFMTFIYLWLLAWAWRQQRTAGVRLRRFFRAPFPAVAPLLRVVVLVLLFSFASFWFVHQALQRLAPELAEQLMESPELLILPMTGPVDFLLNVGVFLVVVLLAPAVEEILFRGFLLNRWGRRWGLAAGILLSSAVFGVLHAHWLGLFVFGLVMALLYVSTGSLWAPFVAHALNNGIAFALAVLGTADLGIVDPGTLEGMSMSGWAAAVVLLISAPLLGAWAGARWPEPHAPLPWDAAGPQALSSDVPRELPAGDASDTTLPPSEQDRP